MNPTQRQEFDTAFQGLTPEQQNTYTTANPNINVGGVSQSFNAQVGAFQPITSADLSGTTTPFNISPTSTGTSAIGLSAETTSLSNAGIVAQDKQDAYTEKLKADALEAEAGKKTSKGFLDSLLGNRKGEIEQTDAAYSTPNEAGTTVDETGRKLREVNARINAVDISTNEQIKQLDNTFFGSPSGKAEAIAGIQRKAASQKADLYIDQLITQGQYDSAKSIADRKVSMLMEKDRMDYEKLVFDYNENKELFTKAEQRQFDAMSDNRKRELDKKEADLKQLSDTNISLMQSASSQGAPQSVIDAISRAKTVEEKIKAAGQYSGDILDRQYKQAQIAKMYSDIAEKNANGKIVVDTNGKVILKQEDALKINKELVSNDAYKAIRKGQDSLQALNAFDAMFSQTGATSREFSPVQNEKLKTTYNAAILNLKEFFNLGVLNGPDETILRGILPSPTDKTIVSLGATGITREGVNNMKRQIETTLDDRFSSLSAQYGDYSTESIGSLRDLQRIYISQKAQLNPQIANFVKENPNLTYEDIINTISNQ